VKLHQFMTSRKLAGAEFSGPTWATWRIVARLIDGDAAMDPLARNASGHVGLMQWDKSRQADFAKQFGYPMGG
jgi:hypothetical protein